MEKVSGLFGFLKKYGSVAMGAVLIALVFMAIPFTGVPATVMSAYGVNVPDGGVGGGTGSGGTVPVPPLSIDMDRILVNYPGFTGQVNVYVGGTQAGNIDPTSCTLGGAAVLGSSMVDGKLVLKFDVSKLKLEPGSSQIVLSGKYKDGTPFTMNVPILVVK